MVVATTLLVVLVAVAAGQTADPFLGQITPFPYTFCPTGWHACDGTLLSISQNTALFSLLGTFYGGDGRSTFALPDLRGRFSLEAGQGPGTSLYDIGQAGGASTVTLTSTQMPSHSHALLTVPTCAVSNAGSSSRLLAEMAQEPLYATSTADRTLAPNSIATTGASQPHENMPPYLAVTICIATQGIFPSRS
ncbi:Phage tail collar domain-containing protein [Plasmodiophora brassicae]|uniref:Phage tail collar domain-containing protein n=1 Tax=Plasmodiophora brassicae TaxID=37360 RepID=A0A0G4IPE7_PLABS|nr:hypothetical protein PBRA_005694 [Plasmodiophora brassicae]SPR01066.1 unnamed protein product [Plasmodiophora brassicae]